MLDRLTVVEVTIAMMRAMIIATVVEAPILAIAILVLAVITVGGASSSGGSSSGEIHDEWYGGWTDEKGNEYNDYYDPNTGNSYDSNGNFQGNMNDWLWD